MIAWILLTLVFLICIYFFTAPFYFEIDSNKGLFRFRFHRLIYLYLTLHERTILLTLKSGFWQKEFDLLNSEKSYKQKKEKKKNLNKKKPFSHSKIIRKVKGVFYSFQIKKCELIIDTGDQSLNGNLYPWLYLLSFQTQMIIRVNFQGENTILLIVKNSIGRIVWAFIKS